MIRNSFQRLLALYFHATTEIYQTQIASFFLYMAVLESKRTYRNGCFLKGRIFKLNQCFNGAIGVQELAQLFIALNEHPHIRREETAITIVLCHSRTAYHKSRKEIALIIRIVGFNEFA